MNKRQHSKSTTEPENPEWTALEVNSAMRLTELPSSLQKKLRGQRGPQKAPRKLQTAIRFDADIVEAFKAQGPGWQTRMNDALREWLKQQA
ncbi:BrnA antitoxin family protein [Pusillimonas sp. DMV24BSW_D]|uniref:BrnA antitoxin family protein n=1 Tax=Neopusillimonas aestuarii TaxID=2716226 RepID=UPI0014085B00|nr:BrnA antitoxin family protein [Pusillimonas sp. DMV24BSW_D]QIM48038.1 BrnA antitoxin family protein [Pusillimonas sp. DMV24BSW_D]